MWNMAAGDFRNEVSFFLPVFLKQPVKFLPKQPVKSGALAEGGH